MNPEISVIIPHYNRSALLAETIASVKRQSFSLWELIIVDDGSTDDELKNLQNFQEPNIHICYRSELPKGPSHCRNIGIAKAKGNYIQFLDSDDLIAPWCLEMRLKTATEEPGFDFYVFPVLLFSESPGDTDQLWNYYDREQHPLARFLAMDNPWCVTSSFWEKKSLQNMGGFDAEIWYGDDVELHIKALLNEFRYKEFPLQIPDSYIRRNNFVPRVTNQVNHEILASKDIFFIKLHQLLIRYNAGKREHRLLKISIFKEIENRLFCRKFNSMHFLKNFLHEICRKNRVLQMMLSFYFAGAKWLIIRNYFLFRIWRRLYIFFLPSYLKNITIRKLTDRNLKN